MDQTYYHGDVTWEELAAVMKTTAENLKKMVDRGLSPDFEDELDYAEEKVLKMRAENK
ncbi:MAG: hypothetical protein K5637_01435 [Lachnospiraceae bacterium]|nr:hypothetical protein [Lachnospiraceae bacterium]